MFIEFTKMHGLGNDFVILYTGYKNQIITKELVQKMAHRRFGVGFDQLLLISHFSEEENVFRVKIYNSDGSQAEQCGNGMRCVAKYLFANEIAANKRFFLYGDAGKLAVEVHEDDSVTVEMGLPKFHPQDIPFRTIRTSGHYQLQLSNGEVDFSVVNIGNPHAVILVEDIVKVDVVAIGQELSQHSYFPQGVNVGFIQIHNKNEITLKVFERGSGETLACGSGACAAVAVGRQLGLLASSVKVKQAGGMLSIEWKDESKPLLMRGSAHFVFEGKWYLEQKLHN